jgi:hypothetical protein
MIKFNEVMAKIAAGKDFSGVPIPDGLLGVLGGGFVLRSDCLILASLEKKCSSVSVSDFPDRTGYECFVNVIHVDDYVDSDYLSYSISFALALIECWRENELGGDIRVVVSNDELGGVVRFHLIREGENWVAENIELYEEAILIVDSDSEVIEEGVFTLHCCFGKAKRR